MTRGTVIGCWFVADTAETSTFFPQIGEQSDAPSSQAVYWRCVVDFYASSIAVNRQAQHLFFTNTALPTIDGVDVADCFDRWGVEVVDLPITYRLPANAVSSWGNQFYIFDILQWIANQSSIARAIILDSDCLWLKPVDDMERAIDVHGALTYTLDTPVAEPINGLSRDGMTRFLARTGGAASQVIPYFGGEIVAARHDVIVQMADNARRLWPTVLEQGPDAPREEAHFLSILYALQGILGSTANAFIRRMWTTFKVHDLKPSDVGLTIWHLPAEKRTGFADLFKDITRNPAAHPSRDAVSMGLDYTNYAKRMGYPGRRPGKFIRDLWLKITQKMQRP